MLTVRLFGLRPDQGESLTRNLPATPCHVITPAVQITDAFLCRHLATSLQIRGTYFPRKGFPSQDRGRLRSSGELATEASFDGYSDYSGDSDYADADHMQSFIPQFDLLGRLVSATELRQRVISNNLANVNTPNYQRLDVEFETALAQELTGKSHTLAAPQIVTTTGLTARADGNNVDIDQEIGQMNKNAMLQQTYLQLLGSHLEQMRLAIGGS
jgi:flagellar basal-body rod protein FlgB